MVCTEVNEIYFLMFTCYFQIVKAADKGKLEMLLETALESIGLEACSGGLVCVVCDDVCCPCG